MSVNATSPRAKSTNVVVGTPPDFLAAVEARFGKLEFDLAASHDCRVCSSYFTRVDNALSPATVWPHRRCWLNPPFSDIAPWVQRCVEERGVGREVLLLVPASVGSEWFAHWVFPVAHVYFLRPRLTFVGHTDPYPKDLMLCHYVHGKRPNGECWRWK